MCVSFFVHCVVNSYNRFVEPQLLAFRMGDQVSVAESIERVSLAGLELAQQLHRAGASGEEVQTHKEEINLFRTQLQDLDVLLATSLEESIDLYAMFDMNWFRR